MYSCSPVDSTYPAMGFQLDCSLESQMGFQLDCPLESQIDPNRRADNDHEYTQILYPRSICSALSSHPQIEQNIREALDPNHDGKVHPIQSAKIDRKWYPLI